MLAPSTPSLLERALRRCPGQCVVCGAWVTQRCCEACLTRFAAMRPRCRTCALPLPPGQTHCGACLHEPPPLDRCIAAVDYAFPWNQLIRRYKVHEAVDLRAVLLEQLDNALNQAEAPDWLLPVPLGPQRLLERGYNQSLELARALARRRGLRCDGAMLLRLRDGEHQAGSPLQARQRNVRRAFAVEPGRQGELRGAHIALLDDVMTTGATLFELARVLRQAGAARVQAWVLARTPQSLND